MGVLREDVERVEAATDFVQIVSEVVQLHKVGRRWAGLCPFHADESRAFSFSVNAEEKLYYCSGCRASGDLFPFVEETQHLSFAASVEWIAAKYGITLRRHE